MVEGHWPTVQRPHHYPALEGWVTSQSLTVLILKPKGLDSVLLHF